MYPYVATSGYAYDAFDATTALRIATIGFALIGLILVATGVAAAAPIVTISGGLLVATAGAGLAASFFVRSLER